MSGLEGRFETNPCTQIPLAQGQSCGICESPIVGMCSVGDLIAAAKMVDDRQRWLVPVPRLRHIRTRIDPPRIPVLEIRIQWKHFEMEMRTCHGPRRTAVADELTLSHALSNVDHR